MWALGEYEAALAGKERYGSINIHGTMESNYVLTDPDIQHTAKSMRTLGASWAARRSSGRGPRNTAPCPSTSSPRCSRREIARSSCKRKSVGRCRSHGPFRCRVWTDFIHRIPIHNPSLASVSFAPPPHAATLIVKGMEGSGQVSLWIVTLRSLILEDSRLALLLRVEKAPKSK